MIFHGLFAFRRTNTDSWVYPWENVFCGSYLTRLNTCPCCPHLLSCLIPNTVMSSTPVIKGTEVTVTLGLEDTMIQKHSSGSKQSPVQAGLEELEVCRMGIVPHCTRYWLTSSFAICLCGIFSTRIYGKLMKDILTANLTS